jgi:hypothetical protein
MIQLERLARLAARLVNSSSAALYLCEGPGARTPRTATCGRSYERVTAERFAVEVAEAGRAAITADRIGVPLVSPAGERLGALCAIGAREPFYDEADLRALADLAVSAVCEIELSLRWAALESDVLDELVDDDPRSEFLAIGTPGEPGDR